jgi:hypothetical protein
LCGNLLVLGLKVAINLFLGGKIIFRPGIGAHAYNLSYLAGKIRTIKANLGEKLVKPHVSKEAGRGWHL